MSRTPEEDAAYALGVEEGTERGTILGATQAWLEVQQWAIARERELPPYTDARPYTSLLDLANDKLLEIGAEHREEAADGSVEQPGQREQPQG